MACTTSSPGRNANHGISRKEVRSRTSRWVLHLQMSNIFGDRCVPTGDTVSLEAQTQLMLSEGCEVQQPLFFLDPECFCVLDPQCFRSHKTRRSWIRGADGASLHEQLVFSSVPRLGQPNMLMIADLLVVHHYAYLSTHVRSGDGEWGASTVWYVRKCRTGLIHCWFRPFTWTQMYCVSD